MTTQWQPYREPLSSAAMRNGTIAIVVGGVFAFLRGGLARWPLVTLLALWPTLGGHFVELWFLNWLRPRLSDARGAQIAARVVVWFISGAGLVMGMALTGMALPGFRSARWPAWWIGGLAFIGIELVAHLALQLRGQPSFFNGRG